MTTLLLLLVTTLTGLQTPAPTVRDIAWMTGCWEMTRNGRHIVEHWTAPEGGTLMAVSRTVAAGKTHEYEFLMIREADGALEYVARPSGQTEATFRSVRVSADDVVFENPTHDFPTRISYRRTEGGLVAATEGERDGKPRRIEFPYARVACDAPPQTR
jgi:hypothetical protein